MLLFTSISYVLTETHSKQRKYWEVRVSGSRRIQGFENVIKKEFNVDDNDPYATHIDIFIYFIIYLA